MFTCALQAGAWSMIGLNAVAIENINGPDDEALIDFHHLLMPMIPRCNHVCIVGHAPPTLLCSEFA
jgi:hypothetical protein